MATRFVYTAGKTTRAASDCPSATETGQSVGAGRGQTIIAGQPPHEVLKFASRRLKDSRVEIFDDLQCDLTASHHFVLDELMPHIEEIEARIARFDARLLDELKDEHNTLALLQTLPGVDLMGAAILLVEIGTDMNALGSASHTASKVGICPGNPSANTNLGMPTRAILVFDGYFASSLMPPVVPDWCTNRSSSLSSFGAAINARSWLSATKCYALFSSCSNGTNITGIQPLTMKHFPFNAMLRVGLKL